MESIHRADRNPGNPLPRRGLLRYLASAAAALGLGSTTSAAGQETSPHPPSEQIELVRRFIWATRRPRKCRRTAGLALFRHPRRSPRYCRPTDFVGCWRGVSRRRAEVFPKAACRCAFVEGAHFLIEIRSGDEHQAAGGDDRPAVVFCAGVSHAFCRELRDTRRAEFSKDIRRY